MLLLGVDLAGMRLAWLVFDYWYYLAMYVLDYGNI